MGESLVWDSPGGLAEFQPRCWCGHDPRAHLVVDKRLPDGTVESRRRRCTVMGPAPCGCRAYRAGDPKDCPAPPAEQGGLW